MTDADTMLAGDFATLPDLIAAHAQARGDRIAQLVPAPVQRAVLEVVEALDDTARGVGGFGSTGR